MLIEYHRNMLADKARNEAFRAALKKVVKKGVTTVADIGSGTGFLGLTALKLGAKEAYLYESAAIMQVAAEIAKKNGLQKKCHFFHGHSTEFLDPPQADVVVSETLGNYPFEENITATLSDAKRFLKPCGVMIPQAIRQFACPVISDRFHKQLTSWDSAGGGLDYSFARRMSLNNVYIRTFKAQDLLDGGKSAQQWDAADLLRDPSSTRKGKAAWTLKNSATVYGIGCWWECDLVPGVTLSTAPSAAKGHWEQLYFPLEKPVAAKKGDVLSITIQTHSSYEGGTDMRWSVALNGKGRQSMDLRAGYLA